MLPTVLTVIEKTRFRLQYLFPGPTVFDVNDHWFFETSFNMHVGLAACRALHKQPILCMCYVLFSKLSCNVSFLCKVGQAGGGWFTGSGKWQLALFLPALNLEPPDLSPFAAPQTNGRK